MMSMLFLIDGCVSKRKGFVRRPKERENTIFRAEYRPVLGLRAAEAVLNIPLTRNGPDRRAVGRAAEQLRSGGAGRVVFSHNVPFKAELLSEGLVEADTGALNLALAARAARAAVRGDTVYFCAGHLTPEAIGALTALCRNFRFVLADIGAGGALVCHELAGRYGVSVVFAPRPEQLRKASAAVLISKPENDITLPEACAVIAADSAYLSAVNCERPEAALSVVTGLSVGVVKEAGALPDGYPPEPLLSEALRAGVLSESALLLRSVRITRQAAPRR